MKGSTLILMHTPPYSCKGRVMTTAEVSKWKEGEPIMSAYETMTFSASPRHIKEIARVFNVPVHMVNTKE